MFGNLSKLLLGCFGFIFMLSFVFLIIGISFYVDADNARKTYDTQTKCLLLDLNYTTRSCRSCHESCDNNDISSHNSYRPNRRFCTTQCTTYTCYDENFLVNYPIFNGSNVTTVISTSGSSTRRSVKVNSFRYPNTRVFSPVTQSCMYSSGRYTLWVFLKNNEHMCM